MLFKELVKLKLRTQPLLFIHKFRLSENSSRGTMLTPGSQTMCLPIKFLYKVNMKSPCFKEGPRHEHDRVGVPPWFWVEVNGQLHAPAVMHGWKCAVVIG
jgi:hypothetical protein